MKIKGIQPPEIDGIWDAIEPLIESGLEYANGCYLPEDVYDACMLGEQQLFAAEDLSVVFVTEIIVYPRRKMLNLFVIAGKLPPDWMATLANLEQWGRDMGCDAICLRGRRGWSRHLKSYKGSMIYLSKELSA